MFAEIIQLEGQPRDQMLFRGLPLTLAFQPLKPQIEALAGQEALPALTGSNCARPKQKHRL